ncbi:roadblock/LC7 domain-containing protein [Streptomyces gardneri]|uniref:roadblock/LC7 domain-containing protein n=1 Tax=Streptomyces gardneri TaxID=66892 RepID=UPI0036814162
MTAAKRPLLHDMSWVLEPLLVLTGVRHAVILSADGLVAGASPGLTREAREGAAAMMSALQGAARSVASELSGDARARLEQVVVAVDSGFVFAVPAGENTVLALFAEKSADLEIVAYHVQIQVATLGEKVMTSKARTTGAHRP